MQGWTLDDDGDMTMMIDVDSSDDDDGNDDDDV
jgi:hypothetical protein